MPTLNYNRHLVVEGLIEEVLHCNNEPIQAKTITTATNRNRTCAVCSLSFL